MTNLHRDLAPISAAAWAEIEEEASRTFKRHVAGRRVVDVEGPSGDDLAAIPLGHQVPINPLADGVIAHARQSQPIIELRVPFTVSRQASTTSNAAPRTPTGSPSRTRPSRSRSPRTAPSSRDTPQPASPACGPAVPTRN